MPVTAERIVASPMNALLPGISVAHLNDWSSLRDRLKINSGTYPIEQVNYQDRARLPQQDWRDLTDGEFSLLLGDGAPDENAQNIYVWRLPGYIQAHMDGFRDSIKRFNDPSLIENIANTGHFLRGRRKLVDLVTRAGVNIGTKAFGHYTRPRDLIVTSVGHTGLMVGLHIDSWFNSDMADRLSGLPNRMCINLGPERRFFMFMNLPLTKLRERLGRPVTDAFYFPAEFMEAFPDYPVIRLEVRPGEAYIAPTEIIIHDATTVGKEFTDATFTILGNFDRSVIANLLADPLAID